MKQYFTTRLFFNFAYGVLLSRKRNLRRSSAAAECAPLWHPQVFKNFKSKPLILLIGQYAQRYYLKKSFKESLTETVRNYQEYLPTYFPLPHPSPRNQNWVKINPWFMEEAVPELKKRIQLAVRGAKQQGKAD